MTAALAPHLRSLAILAGGLALLSALTLGLAGIAAVIGGTKLSRQREGTVQGCFRCAVPGAHSEPCSCTHDCGAPACLGIGAPLHERKGPQ